MGNRFSHVAFKGDALYLPILNLSMAHQIRFRFVVQTRASFTRLSWKQPRFLAIQIPFGRNTAFQTNKRCNGSELLKGRVSCALEPRFLSYLFSFARFSGRVPQQRERITAVPWRPDHNIGNSVPYSLRMMSGFFTSHSCFMTRVVRRDLQLIVLILIGGWLASIWNSTHSISDLRVTISSSSISGTMPSEFPLTGSYILV